MMAHAYNPSTREARISGSGFKTSLSNLARPCLKIKYKGLEPSMMGHTCDPSTSEAETGGLQVHSQPQLLREALCNLVRPCFKIKN